MSKINYVIATYNGKCKRTHSYPHPKDVLITHLMKINTLKHSLTQITIMKPQSTNYYEDYYNITNIVEQYKIPIKIIDCANYGYSCGQWMTAYELFKDEFDHYIFMEDDYCPNMDNFDLLLLQIYKQKFPKNIGLLCSLIVGTDNYKYGGYPIHWSGGIFISTKTLQKLYNTQKWSGDPKKYLNLMSSDIDPYFNWEQQRQGYIGGYYQVAFSHLFTLSGIKQDDYLDVYHENKILEFAYWCDIQHHPDGGLIWLYDKGNVKKFKFTQENILNSPIIPVQLHNIMN